MGVENNVDKQQLIIFLKVPCKNGTTKSIRTLCFANVPICQYFFVNQEELQGV